MTFIICIFYVFIAYLYRNFNLPHTLPVRLGPKEQGRAVFLNCSALKHYYLIAGGDKLAMAYIRKSCSPPVVNGGEKGGKAFPGP